MSEEKKLLCSECGREMAKPYMSGPGLKAAAQWCSDCSSEKMRNERKIVAISCSISLLVLGLVIKDPVLICVGVIAMIITYSIAKCDTSI